MDEAVPIDFCTLGMLIIDEIHYLPPKPPVYDVIGGAGSYAAIGARLHSPPPLSRSVGWVVDAGSDFPTKLRQVIKSWDTSCLVRETPGRLTTRGWNGYGDDEERAFKYTTPKLRLDHTSLSEPLLRSRSFHLICSPKRCIDLVTNILAQREKLNNSSSRPLFIWEPVPDLCVPTELENFYDALHYVDVVSPNESEMRSFYESPHGNAHDHPLILQNHARDWVTHGIGPDRKGAVVVRRGAQGCSTFDSSGIWKNYPAYHPLETSQNAERVNAAVVDPTGGGNTFVGGLAVGLVRGGEQPGLQNLEIAIIWASVAASYAIEQVGLPVISHSIHGTELWNRQCVRHRIEAFNRKCKMHPGNSS
ncbi:MAG: hypothetical protein M1834_007400 [Cirrosporium novae-zelandiae]|nr:MAG: hypothetical protein M1834_007400 [Cirrosporium novae-zelandiae]